MGVINGNNNQVTINISDQIPPSNVATIDKDGKIGNAVSKEKFQESFDEKSLDLDKKISDVKEQLKTDFRGTLSPMAPAPTEDGSYKPEISSELDKPTDPSVIIDWGTKYPNAGGLRAKQGYDTLFYKKGSVWAKSEDKKPDFNEEKLNFLIGTKSGIVSDYNSCTWVDGSYYNADGTIGSAVNTFSRNTNYIPISGGKSYVFVCSGVAIIWYNDSNQVVGSGGSASDSIVKERTFTAPAGATKCRVNILTSNKLNFVLSLKNIEYAIKKDVIRLQDINGVNVLFTELENYNSCTWVPGKYLDSSGAVQSFSSFNYCSNYITVVGGQSYTFRSSGTCVVWYDVNKNVVGSGGNASDLSAQRIFVAPVNAIFCRVNQHNENLQTFSFRNALPDGSVGIVQIPNLKVNANQVIGSISSTVVDQSKLSKIGDVKLFNFASFTITGNIITSGDSTVAPYAGGAGVASIIKCTGTVTDISVPGETIAQQLGHWNALTSVVRSAANYVFAQIGLNDLGPSSASTAVTIQALKDYISKIRTDSPTAVIVAGEMLPCKQRFINLWGENDGSVAYSKWKAINAALPTITGVNRVATIHGWLLNDGNDNLKSEFDTGDAIHENTNGRKMIAYSWLIATL